MTQDKRPEPTSQEAQAAPKYRPGGVPAFAEYVWAIPHFRTQYHPLFHNSHDMPDHNGPREYLGLDFQCVMPGCHKIQTASNKPPGKEFQCEDCGTYYLYTALADDCWLWFWKYDSEPLILEDKSNVNEST